MTATYVSIYTATTDVAIIDSLYATCFRDSSITKPYKLQLALQLPTGPVLIVNKLFQDDYIEINAFNFRLTKGDELLVRANPVCSINGLVNIVELIDGTC